MERNIKEVIEELIDEVNEFHDDPLLIDQRVKILVIEKLQEASMWLDQIHGRY